MSPAKGPSLKQLGNEKALKVYAAALCVLFIAISSTLWLRALCNKALRPWPSGGSQDRICKAVLLVSRKLERRAEWKCFGQPSFGLLVVLGTLLVINVLLCFNFMDTYRVNYLASRMAVANTALCVLLALRNSPLVFPTSPAAISHSTLCMLHRIIGYSVAFLVLLHAVFYTVHFGRQNRWETLIEINNALGIAAAAAMLILLLGILRHRSYELFYISHVIAFVSVVALTGLHRPDWVKKVPVAMAFIACMWLLDRAARATRMLRNLVNNQAAVRLLPGGGVRLLLWKSYPMDVVPGSHCFLWIPEISIYQTHPFTIVSNGPSGLELVIKSHSGFTRALCDFAARRQDNIRWASVDGPYGALPDVSAYEKLILVAGGSGAAFTFGLVNRILSHPGRIATQSLDFVWSVRHIEQVSWFQEHLLYLSRIGPSVNVTIYVTASGRVQGVLEDDLPGEISTGTESVSETGEMERLLASRSPRETLKHAVNLNYERMDAETIICEAMQSVSSQDRVLVAVCGPDSLMEAVQGSVDKYRSNNSCRIDLHREGFSG